MITILQEITDWDMANGIYHVNDHDQLVGYQGPTSEYKEFEKPKLRFSRSGRKFEVIGTRDEEGEADDERVEFEGSNGSKYYVTDNDGILSCTCPGYKFRGHCKHVKEVEELG